MNGEEAKKLLLQLLNAPTADKVKEIIESKEVAKQLGWRRYGDVENNYGQMASLSSDSIRAFSEKVVNSIDALLTKACMERGLDPKKQTRYQTMRDAVEDFYGVPKGDLTKIGDERIRELAKNIIVFADGPKNQPNICILDRGEGQHPKDFPTTLVSLSKTNKINIKFVQGKFNMGGAGALVYCKNGYQLILSRRPTTLLNGSEDLWGFTLTRENNATDTSVPWYEYCVDAETKNVPSFKGCDLEIEQLKEKLQSGCLIKLYGYELRDKSIIVAPYAKSFWAETNRMLFSPVLPLLMRETRDFDMKESGRYQYMKGIYSRIQEASPWYKDKIKITAELGDFGKKDIVVYVFKPKDKKNKEFPKGSLIPQNAVVFFTVNGQTHYVLPKYWVESNLQFSWLKDYMLIHIDMSDAGNRLNKIFMPNRENVRRIPEWEAFEKALIEELKMDNRLTELNEEYRKLLIPSKLGGSDKVKKIMAKLISENPQIAKLLGLGLGLPLPMKEGNRPPPLDRSKFPSSYLPTYLRVRGFASNVVFDKKVPANSYVWVYLETDAPNDYTSRDRDRGEWVFKHSDAVRIGGAKIEDGSVPLRVYSLEDKVKVGTKEPVTVLLTCPDGNPLSVKLNMEVIAPIEKKINPPGKPKPKAKDYNIPEFKPITKDNWPEGWDGTTISDVKESPNKIDAVLVNMDSDVLHSYLNQMKAIDEKLTNDLYLTVIGLLSISVFNSFSKTEQKHELTSTAMKGVADMILPIVFNVDLLK